MMEQLSFSEDKPIESNDWKWSFKDYPSKVFMYGNVLDGLDGNIEKVKTFAESRWKNG